MVTLKVTQKTMTTSMEISKKGERILEFCATMNMVLGNTLFKKRVSHLVTYESGISKTQVDYCLVRRNQQKFLKEISLTITQHKPLVCDFNKRKLKDTRKKFVPRRKIRKL